MWQKEICIEASIDNRVLGEKERRIVAMHIIEYLLEGMAHRRLQISQCYRRKTECKTKFFETFDKS